MDVYEAIRLRKSIRQFRDREIPEEVLTPVLEAGRLAPSAKNFQEWRFVVVKDPETRKRLAQAAREQMFIAQAPVVLVCCAQTDHHVMTCGQTCYPIDVSIAIDHITLAAVAEGLGTCWIGAFFEDQVKEILGIPEEIRVVELLPMGYPVDPSEANKSRLPLEEIVFPERWPS